MTNKHLANRHKFFSTVSLSLNLPMRAGETLYILFNAPIFRFREVCIYYENQVIENLIHETSNS